MPDSNKPYTIWSEQFKPIRGVRNRCRHKTIARSIALCWVAAANTAHVRVVPAPLPPFTSYHAFKRGFFPVYNHPATRCGTLLQMLVVGDWQHTWWCIVNLWLRQKNHWVAVCGLTLGRKGVSYIIKLWFVPQLDAEATSAVRSDIWQRVGRLVSRLRTSPIGCIRRSLERCDYNETQRLEAPPSVLRELLPEQRSLSTPVQSPKHDRELHRRLTQTREMLIQAAHP